MSGRCHYLLRVVVADMPQYDAFYKKLISRVKLTGCFIILCHGTDQAYDSLAVAKG